MRGDGDKPAVGLTRALSWLAVSSLSHQTRRLFGSQSELRANRRSRRGLRSQSRSHSRSHTHLHAAGGEGRADDDDNVDDDDDWVYEPQHRTGCVCISHCTAGRRRAVPSVTVVKRTRELTGAMMYSRLELQPSCIRRLLGMPSAERGVQCLGRGKLVADLWQEQIVICPDGGLQPPGKPPRGWSSSVEEELGGRWGQEEEEEEMPCGHHIGG
ncbi:hypothetical protein N1851_033995 [Merluccius polli]|uniref:Uncharacterized protein n=1 Tax=Merluccius polli TaxID=89951 RepID=A0AA47M0F5_MERPO|nr:hypothetical protein N1851_033995 [Merluccius polli]